MMSLLSSFILLFSSSAFAGGVSSSSQLFQIGDQWDRETMGDPKSFPFQVFQLYRTGMGAMGTGVYLGKFADQHIVMTAGHVYKDLVSCAEEVNFLFLYQDIRFYVTCTGWFHKFVDNDVMLFSITTKNTKNLNVLKPLDFDIQHTLGQQLQMVGVNRGDTFNFTWSTDNQADCRLLSAQEKWIQDPDFENAQSSELGSWSLPVGCDGRPGDSGAPVYTENLKLKGIVWTGSYPKMVQSSYQLEMDFLNQSEKLWSDYNYIVPISTMVREMDSVLAKTTDKSTKKILGAISSKIKSTN